MNESPVIAPVLTKTGTWALRFPPLWADTCRFAGLIFLGCIVVGFPFFLFTESTRAVLLRDGLWLVFLVGTLFSTALYGLGRFSFAECEFDSAARRVHFRTSMGPLSVKMERAYARVFALALQAETLQAAEEHAEDGYEEAYYLALILRDGSMPRLSESFSPERFSRAFSETRDFAEKVDLRILETEPGYYIMVRNRPVRGAADLSRTRALTAFRYHGMLLVILIVIGFVAMLAGAVSWMF